ncbi:MAG: fibronectin type III domain-containing protein, partial [Bacteroidales bacterium]|nr:fibronectin type III domain-containing protein [Candidatus Colimorpha onthohippi]
EGQPVDNNAICTGGTADNCRPNIRFNFCHNVTPCPVVENLDTANMSYDSIDLSWRTTDTIDYYAGFEVVTVKYSIADGRWTRVAEVRRDTVDGDTNILSSHDARFTLKGLQSNTGYRVFVRTLCDGDPLLERSAYDSVQFRTLPWCKPVSHIATTPNKTGAYIAWSRGNEETPDNFAMRITTTPQDVDTMTMAGATITGISNNVKSVTDLNCETKYYIYIANDCGSEVSPWTSIKTADGTADSSFTTSICCTQPVSLQVNRMTSHEAYLGWSRGAGGDETQWRITYVYGDVADSQDLARTKVVTNRSTLIDTVRGLVPDQTYRFYIQADCGEGSYSRQSNLATGTTLDTVAYFATYSLDGQIASAVDPVHRTVIVTMPYGSDMSSMLATFTLGGTGAVAKIGNTVQMSGDTYNSFVTENPLEGSKRYRLFAEDENIYYDWTVTVRYEGCAKPTEFAIDSTGHRILKFHWSQPDATILNHDFIVSTSELNVTQLTNYAGTIYHATAGLGTNVDNQFRLAGLTPGTTYYIYVRANCGGSVSEWQYDASTNKVTMQAIGCPEIASFDVALTGDGTHTGTARWTIENPEDYYLSGYDVIISRDTISTAAGFLAWAGRFSSTGGDSMYVNVDTLAADTKYYLFVRAQCLAENHNNYGAWTGASFRTYAVCRYPESFAFQSSGIHAGDVRWVNSRPELGNNYSWALFKRDALTSVNEMGDWSNLPSVNDIIQYGNGVTDTTVHLTDLDCSPSPTDLTEYYFYAANDCGEFDGKSRWTGFSFTMPVCCVAPANLTVDTVGNTNARVKWNRGLYGEETEWDLQCIYKDHSNVEHVISTVEHLTDSVYTLTNLATVLPYIVKVRARCGESTYSVWSSPVTFTTTLPFVCDFSNVAEQYAWWSNTSGNRWVVNTGVSHSASKSLYVSTNGSN